MKKRITLTTPIFYPNSSPHLGTVHTLVLTDFLARCFRLFGYEVFFVTGQDQHGEKIAKTASERQIPVEEFLKNQNETFLDTAKKLQISYDRWICTTEPLHRKAVQHLWRDLVSKGYIYKGIYKGFYSVRDETFFSESELINGKAPTGADVKEVEHECFFLKTSAFREYLLSLYNSHKDFTIPSNRINELKGFMKDELRDLCISRPKGWGIDTPDADQTIYVWFDALINYITACGYPNLDERWFNVVHVVGKDIAIFHGIHWPVILKASGIDNFKTLLIHNWWLVDQEKMSKSLGNVIDPTKLLEHTDLAALRFFLIKENLISSDSNFDIEKIKENFNTFLVGKFSNLCYRVFTLTYKHKIPLNILRSSIYEDTLLDHLKNFKVTLYLNTLLEWCDDLNAQVEQKTVWKNLDALEPLASEILLLIKYFSAIIPDLQNFDPQQEPTILFTKKE